MDVQTAALRNLHHQIRAVRSPADTQHGVATPQQALGDYASISRTLAAIFAGSSPVPDRYGPAIRIHCDDPVMTGPTLHPLESEIADATSP
jgi:hypothetical protein